MVTQAKTTGTQEATRHHGTYQDDQATRHTRMHSEDDAEFDDDDNQRLEGYDENELDADDRRNRREAALADGDAAAHEQPQKRTPSRRGFAAMDKEKQRAIASKGGKASHGGGRKPSKNR
ncbi:KGG domain-containing protein [Chitinophaga sp. YIM B06452]|uniref:KGG domain-containing protein n=1 Tax=Chitinophaga sp. YIM B06452 TaxID=3082158 RepID=UPI0031FEBC9B